MLKVQPHPTRLARRRLGAAALASVAVTAIGLTVASRLKSPAQIAAETAPPPRSVLTEAVQKRVLTATVVLRGRVAAEQSVDVVARGSGEGAPVVTAVKVKYGDKVEPAQVVLEISGRPVFAMSGEIPMYRDLRPGDTGKDVAQLQASLRALGFGVSDQAGSYGPGTKSAVLAFYQSKGYPPQPASEQDDALLSQAKSAVTAAQRALRDARIARDKARADGSGELTALELAVSDHSADLTEATTEQAKIVAKTGPMVPASEIVFLAGFPGRVDSVTTAVGATAQAKLLTVSAGRLVVKGQLTPYQKGLVHPGQQVSIVSEVSGVTATATVHSVSDSPHQPDPVAGAGAGQAGQQAAGAPAVGGTSYDLVATASAALDPALAGQDVRVTVTAASSNDPVLVVPLAAVSAGGDGKTSVTVVTEAARRRVEVTPGLVGDGFVQVTPVGTGTLTPADRVLIGS